MNLETLQTLPDGKTVFPGELVVNKMGKSIVLDLQIRLSLEGKPDTGKKQEKRDNTSNRN